VPPCHQHSTNTNNSTQLTQFNHLPNTAIASTHPVAPFNLALLAKPVHAMASSGHQCACKKAATGKSCITALLCTPQLSTHPRGPATCHTAHDSTHTGPSAALKHGPVHSDVVQPRSPQPPDPNSMAQHAQHGCGVAPAAASETSITLKRS